MKTPFIRSPYNYDRKQASDEAVVKHNPDGEISRTIQSQTEDTDINIMMARMGLGFPMPQNYRLPEFGDYSEITDYATALEAISEARDHFMELPAHIRQQMDNDPHKFLTFCADKGNLAKLQEWGLANPTQPATIPTPDTSTGST